MTMKQYSQHDQLSQPEHQDVETTKNTALLIVKSDLFSAEMLESPRHESLYALWAVRLFTNPSYFKRFNKRRHHFGGLDLQSYATLIGTEYDKEQEDSDELRLAYFKQSEDIKQKLEPLNPEFNGLLKTNLYSLGKLIALSRLDCVLLGFFCLFMNNKDFVDFTNEVGEMNRQDLYECLALMLKFPAREIAGALAKDAKLFKTGLLRLNQRDNNDLQRKIEVLDGLSDVLMSETDEPLELLAQYFYRTHQAEMTLDCFPHLKNDSQALIAYLQAKKQHQGVNILIHGEPGTGKTQWVKSLAAQLNLALYEVSAEDTDGDALPHQRRVEVFRLAQNALAHQGQTLVLFDEVEDVFPQSASWISGARSNRGNKAWINKLLEENPVPTFWISNKIQHIDPAYIRRFDMVIEVTAPPRSVRKTIIRESLEGLNVSDAWVDQLAKESQLVPALIERSAKVVRTIQTEHASAHDVEKQVLELINKTLKAQGKKAIKLKNPQSNLKYSLDYVNTDINLAKLVEGLKQSQSGRFCLYGLPGTGKTAFGHYVAEALEKPLIIKRASDLLSPYVGEAEQNIAAAFEEAMQEDAVLQIDEADSFLQSREKAQRSWEVTQVNEMLTQIEAFEGVFIASTNLVKDLDQAAMRRFDVKLEFKPLKPDQAWCLFEQLLQDHSLDSHAMQALKDKIAQLDLLTPGDFSAVKRKLSLGYQDLEPGLVLEALQEECSYKPGYNKSSGIGFLTELNKRHSA